MRAVPRLDVPAVGTIPEDWSFLSGLPGGGVAVRAAESEQVLLLDAALAPTAAVTIAGLGSVLDLGISVSDELGLVAVSFDDALRVYDVASGAQAYELVHGTWPAFGCSAWTPSNGLLWAVIPTGTPAVDEVVAIDPRTWTTVGRMTVHAPSSNQAYYSILPSPAGDQVAVFGALADSDGFYLLWAHWDGTAVVSPGKLTQDYDLADISLDGREIVALTDTSPAELAVVDVATGQVIDRLDLNALTESDEDGDDDDEDEDEDEDGYLFDEVEDEWDRTTFWLTADHLVAPTGESRLLLLRRGPLRVVAQLSLEGYRFSPLDEDPSADGDDDALPSPKSVVRWGRDRLVTTHSDGGVPVSRIYDLSAIDLP